MKIVFTGKAYGTGRPEILGKAAGLTSFQERKTYKPKYMVANLYKENLRLVPA
jgi:hypothetical protein